MDRGAWWTTVHGVAESGTTERLTLLLTDHKVSEVKSLRRVRLFATPWTIAYQAPPSRGFFQARVLEWGAISLCMVSSQPRDRTWVSHIAGRHFAL